MKEWLLIITTMWGDGYVGGEAKYVGGPYASLPACVQAMATHRLPKPLIGYEHKLVRLECVLRDAEANH